MLWAQGHAEPLPEEQSQVSNAQLAKDAGRAVDGVRRKAEGSLFVESQYQALTSDRRRFAVGELLTVLIAETSTASSSADTGTHRDSQVGLSAGSSRLNKSLTASANNDFSGTGRTLRTGRVLGQITVVVRDVLENGDLLVSGEQLLEINGEKQTIKVEGRVRPRDVNEQNVVPSTRLAESRLSFVGEGVLGETQRPRWWQRLLSLFGI